MRGLGLGFTNPLGTGGVLDVCLYLGCGGVGGVGEKWIGGLDPGLEGWCGLNGLATHWILCSKSCGMIHM